MKKLFLALAITSFAANASAVNVTPPASAINTTPPAASLNSLNPSAADEKPASTEKHEYKDPMKNWETLTKAEKIKIIEERHAKREAKWKSLSGDEKLAQYEKRRANFKSMREKRLSNKAPAAATASPAPAAPATKQ